MSDFEISAPQPAGGLTQLERVVDTFTAPSKTFLDIKRNQSWWLPFVLTLIFSYAFTGAIQWKVGWQQVAENSIHADSKAQEKLATATPAQRESTTKLTASILQASLLASPLLGLVIVGIISLVLMGTINFGFGGKARYVEVFSMSWYAGLPGILKSLLGTLALLFGLAPESFNIKNFAGTNLGYFLDPASTNKVLYTLATSLDAVTLWTLALSGIGLAIVAGVKKSAGLAAVFAWWAVVVIFQVVAAALS